MLPRHTTCGDRGRSARARGRRMELLRGGSIHEFYGFIELHLDPDMEHDHRGSDGDVLGLAIVEAATPGVRQCALTARC